jgi:hypothetical protein
LIWRRLSSIGPCSASDRCAPPRFPQVHAAGSSVKVWIIIAQHQMLYRIRSVMMTWIEVFAFPSQMHKGYLFPDWSLVACKAWLVRVLCFWNRIACLMQVFPKFSIKCTDNAKRTFWTMANMPFFSDQLYGIPFLHTGNAILLNWILYRISSPQMGLILKCNAIKENTNALRSWTR